MTKVRTGKEAYAPAIADQIESFLSLRMAECGRAIEQIEQFPADDPALAQFVAGGLAYWRNALSELKRCKSLLLHARRRWNGEHDASK